MMLVDLVGFVANPPMMVVGKQLRMLSKDIKWTDGATNDMENTDESLPLGPTGESDFEKILNDTPVDKVDPRKKLIQHFSVGATRNLTGHANEEDINVCDVDCKPNFNRPCSEETDNNHMKGCCVKNLTLSPVVAALFTHLGAGLLSEEAVQAPVQHCACQPHFNWRSVDETGPVLSEVCFDCSMKESGMVPTCWGADNGCDLTSAMVAAKAYVCVNRSALGASDTSDQMDPIVDLAPNAGPRQMENHSLLGNWVATGVQAVDVENLHKITLKKDFWTVCTRDDEDFRCNTLSVNVNMMVALFLADFTEEFNGFSAVTDWMMHWAVLTGYLKSQNQWVPVTRPHCVTDLHHQVHSMHNRITPLRLAMVDGCNRACSTLLALFRKKPELNADKLLFNRTKIVDVSMHAYVESRTRRRTQMAPNCSRVGAKLLRVDLPVLHSFGHREKPLFLCRQLQGSGMHLLDGDVVKLLRKMSERLQRRAAGVDSASLTQTLKSVLNHTLENPCHCLPETQPGPGLDPTRLDVYTVENKKLHEKTVDVHVENCLCICDQKDSLKKAHDVALQDLGAELSLSKSKPLLEKSFRTHIEKFVKNGRVNDKQWSPGHKLGCMTLVTMGALPLLCPRGFSQKCFRCANLVIDSLMQDPREKLIHRDGLWHPSPTAQIDLDTLLELDDFGPCLSVMFSRKQACALTTETFFSSVNCLAV